MRAFALTHVSDRDLLLELESLVVQERSTTAELIAHIAEADARKLYAPAGYPSMFAYCVDHLRLSDDAAYKRIQAARAARRFPALLTMLEEGRLHLTGVGMMAPYLTEENVGGLLDAAAGKSKSEIESLIAQRFPRTETMPMVHSAPVSAGRHAGQLAPAQVEKYETKFDEDQLAPAQVENTAATSRVKPIAHERFELHLTIGRRTHEKLACARELLSHRVPAADLEQVLERALDALIPKLEKQKFAATEKPRSTRRVTIRKRTIPAHVKRAVWQRDRGRCTFVGTNGHRCGARTMLEFDHVDPVARGGEASVSGIRLRCRAHNQLEADRAFGTDFMRAKCDAARKRAPRARSSTEGDRRHATAQRTVAPRAAAEHAAAERAAIAAKRDAAAEVIPYLRALGFRKDEARRAAESSEGAPGHSLEERVKRALSCFRPRGTKHVPAPA